MAHQDSHAKSPAELQDDAWKLAESIRFCMFTTWDGERQRLRPLTAMPDREHHAIHFLIGKDGGLTLAKGTGEAVPSLMLQIEQFPIVSLGFADPGKGDFLAITGRAKVSNDREKIRELFTPFAKAWWDSPDDPDIRLVTVSPEDAELWDGPHKLVAATKMLAAAATGTKPAMGEHGAVRL